MSSSSPFSLNTQRCNQQDICVSYLEYRHACACRHHLSYNRFLILLETKSRHMHYKWQGVGKEAQHQHKLALCKGMVEILACRGGVCPCTAGMAWTVCVSVELTAWRSVPSFYAHFTRITCAYVEQHCTPTWLASPKPRPPVTSHPAKSTYPTGR